MDIDEKLELIGDILDLLTEMSMNEALETICEADSAEKVLWLLENK